MSASRSVVSIFLLLIDDHLNRIQQLLANLQTPGVEQRYQQVSRADDFLQAINNRPDLILSHCNLPDFSARQVIQLLQRQDCHIPLILVADPGEETEAIEMVRSGAADYISFDRPTRMLIWINRALLSAQCVSLNSRERLLQVEAAPLGVENSHTYPKKPAKEAMHRIDQAPLPKSPPWLAKGGVTPLKDEWLVQRDSRFLNAEESYELIGFQSAPAFQSISTDTTQRKQIEYELLQSEETYRSIFNSSSDATFIHDAETGAILDMNERARAIFDIGKMELPAGSNDLPSSPTSPFTETIALNWIHKAAAEGEQTFEWISTRKDHSQFLSEVTLRPVTIHGAKRVLAVVRDMTTYKLAEQALRESEQRYRDLFENSPIPLLEEDLSGLRTFLNDVRANGVTDLDAYLTEHPDLLAECNRQVVVIDANRAAVHLLNASSKLALLGKPPFLPSPHALGSFRKALVAVAAGVTNFRTEEIYTLNDGAEIQIAMSCSVLPGCDQTYGRVLFSLMDITDRVRAVEELRQRETQLDQLLQQMPLPISVSGPDGTIMVINQAMLEALGGLPAEAIVGKTNVFTDPYLQAIHLTSAIQEAYTGKLVTLPEVEINQLPNQPAAIQSHTRPGKCYEITIFPIFGETGDLWRVAAIWSDITAGRQAERDLARRLAELEALNTIAQAGTDAASLKDLLGRVVSILGDRLYTEDFDIIFINWGQPELEFLPDHGVGKSASFVPITDDHGLTGWVARNKLPRRSGNVHLEKDYLMINPATRSELCVPLTIGERVIGVINAESAHPDAFDEADQRLLMAVASELGTAFERVRLLNAEQARRRELETLAEVSEDMRIAQNQAEIFPRVLDRVIDLLGAQGAALALQDSLSEGGLVFELCRGVWKSITGMRIPPGLGIGSAVAATQEPFVSDDPAHEPRLFYSAIFGNVDHLLCVPLIAAQRTIGLLYVNRTTCFATPDIHLTQAIADIAASALYRARLHEQTERHLRHETALRAIDQAILSNLDMGQTLNVLVEQITTQLGVDAANLLIYKPQTNTLETGAYRGIHSAVLDSLVIPIGALHAGRVALERKMIFLPDLDQADDPMTRDFRKAGLTFTSYLGLPLIAKGKLKGVLELLNRSRIDIQPEWDGFLQALAGQAAIAIDNYTLFSDLQRSNKELTLAYDDTIDGWSRALDLRDRETEGHSQRVTEITLKLARYLGLPETEIPHMRRGARLHDIGKLGIPDEILLKPGPLTDEEWKIMRLHPQRAYDLLAPIGYLHSALDIPYCHHEKWDGSGYPRGLQGTEIPLSARIFAIVDVWDALCSDRPYRPGWEPARALEYIREQSGQHFDPQVVQAFLQMIKG